MQTFSKLHTFCSSRGNKGFTLIELLISIAIIGIMTAIVVVRYGSFHSTTILKGDAYDVALNIREAQVKSISAARSEASPVIFDRPYGLSFGRTSPMTDNKAYQLFVNDDLTEPLIFESGEENLALSVKNSSYISDLCIENGVLDECGLEKLDISFKRPEYRALIYAKKGASEYTDPAYAKVKLKSTRGETEFVVTVSKLGQINIDPETSP